MVPTLGRRLWRGARKVMRRLRRLSWPLTHPPYRQILDDLEAKGDDPGPAARRMVELERAGVRLSRRDALVDLLDSHPVPHWVNFLLCMDEYKGGIDEVKSYPPYVWMELSSICSVECRFCKYTHQHLPKKTIKLEQVQAVEWLKYVQLLNLTSGTAEAITNPQFIDIFDYLRTSYPHLHLSFLTNGRTLNPRILEAIAGRLDALHVSMNASNEEDYNWIIANGNWHQFSRNMKLMRDAFKNHKRPSVTASFVIMKSNVHRVLQHLEFAATHGASVVLFHHYYPHYIPDLHQDNEAVLHDKFGPEESLYFHKDLSDHYLGQVAQRANELGVQAIVPPPFAAKQTHIAFGVRSLSPVSHDCIDPWTKLYLMWGFKSKREEVTICCGLAADLGVYFDRDEVATRSGLFKVRNSPTLRAYRRSVNASQVNPICDMCRKVDRFAPNASYPDQRTFFTFHDLPIPPHFQGVDQPWQPKIVQLGLRSKETA